MLKRLFKKDLESIVAYFVLLITVCVIAFVNYHSGSILSGWDNLHPEFDFALNLKRSVFAVWQEYQGLGLLGGMGHAADIFRQLYMWIISLVTPNVLNRYIFHFAMLFIGAAGIFTLIKRLVLQHSPTKISTVAGWIGGTIYIFNLITLQMFYVPFEAYSSHFGFLPWLIYSALNFLRYASLKNLLFLTVVNILGVSQGIIGTYFLVYMLTLTLTVISNFKDKNYTKKLITLYVIVIVTNAFWLLPNLYFIYKKVDVNLHAKINQMSTDDIFLRNKKYGDIESVIQIKGFWFDNIEIDASGSQSYQLGEWIDYMNLPMVKAIGYIQFIIVLVGIFAVFIKKVRTAAIFIPSFLLAFTVLANDSPIFSQLASLFYKIPLFSQVFRFPFTKLSIVYLMTFAIFYSVGFVAIVQMVRRVRFHKVFFLVGIVLPLLVTLPILKGKFFYNKVQAYIPSDYFAAFDYFNRQKQGRIANFPQNTFWGWTFFRWNYSGSGFIWYGIQQPILDRAFDVWSRENENYYHEISYALYSGNQGLFERLLDKYQIRWLLIDGNVVSYSNNKELYSDRLEQMINNSSKLDLAKTFGKINIYGVRQEAPENQFIYLKNIQTIVRSEYKWNNYDRAFEDFGDYISDQSSIINNHSSIVYYPFRSLFTGRAQEDLEFTLNDMGEYFSLFSTIPNSIVGGQMLIPQVSVEDAIEIRDEEFVDSIARYPRIYVDGEFIPFDPSSQEGTQIELTDSKNTVLEVRIPKIGGQYSYDSLETGELFTKTPFNCNAFSNGIFNNSTVKGREYPMLRLTSVDANNCFDINLPHLSQRFAYLVGVESRFVRGKNLLVAINNNQSQKADIETYLPQRNNITTSYFIQPPMEEFGNGYSFHFDNVSIGRVRTVNDIGRVTVNPFPYRFLTGLKIVKNPQLTINNEQLAIKDISVKHPNPSYYEVAINPSNSLRTGNQQSTINNATLVLSQSFDSGWKAYDISGQLSVFSVQLAKMFPFVFGKELKDHVLVNNWSNGWQLPQQLAINNKQSTIVIIYLPQYLQYLGFALLGVFFLYLLVQSNMHLQRSTK